ncbi:ABC transporter ATP-binding protein [Paenibacillus lentus]|uniref:ABC transporter ATP-binding protein n=1 Tax=Paenibacillus lentus TaxID=1338368 RepID=A0A3Q8S4L5_9BACL|nr:ABC transporter ATP-binding protein [Paenibacillus lentus]AZK46445.1 ABC transporter ATP-binding protein [Paenibacillus lentus]
MNYIIQTLGLSKAYEGKEVISNVNLNVRKGEIYGFLGPNGSGKTTIMKMLTNLVKPTTGDILLFNEHLTASSYEVLGRLGSIIEYPIFYEKMTAAQNLELHGKYMGYPNKHAILEALEMVGLKNTNQKPVKEFSLGMKQRLGIARAIMTKPELLILDEPINGLDPLGIKEIRHLFQVLNKDYGITLLISTHLLSEIEQIADTIGVISEGRLIEEVSMESIRGQNTEFIELITTEPSRAAAILDHQLRISNFKVLHDRNIRIYDNSISQGDIFKALVLQNIEIEAINKKVMSLEEYFLDLVQGDSKRDQGGVH